MEELLLLMLLLSGGTSVHPRATSKQTNRIKELAPRRVSVLSISMRHHGFWVPLSSRVSYQLIFPNHDVAAASQAFCDGVKKSLNSSSFGKQVRLQSFTARKES